MNPSQAYIAYNRLLTMALAGEFRAVFGKPLNTYWQGNILGFDVVKFDEEVLQSRGRGQAPIDVIRERFGERGILLEEKLLHHAHLSSLDISKAKACLPEWFVDQALKGITAAFPEINYETFQDSKT